MNRTIELTPILTTLRNRTTRSDVSCMVRFDLTEDDIRQTESRWSPIRSAAHTAILTDEGSQKGPQHLHWNWNYKIPKLLSEACLAIGIENDGDMQGLALLIIEGYRSWRPHRLPLVYLDYIESAPWNVRGIVDEPRLSGVGTRLIGAAIHVSTTLGFQGRLGLHSLDQAEHFYQHVCGMTDYGQDPEYYHLRYYELDGRPDRETLERTGS